jgi:hypothetical protein
MGERTGASTWTRVIRCAGLGSIAAAALLVGCTRPKPPPGPPAPRPTRFTDEAKQVQASAPESRPWFCSSTGTGTPPSGHGNGSHVNPAYEGQTKGPLSWDVCHQLAAQLDQTLGAVQGLETRAKGEAAGFMGFGEYLPGLGTHHGKFANLSSPFDPAKPTFLIYGGKSPSSPLVGVAFRVANTSVPPEGYAGGNDWYHHHSKVCVGTGGILGGGEELPDADCKALGGTNVAIGSGGDLLLHVWLPPYEYRPDIFVSGHPCLLAAGLAPSTDPCWELARRDPSQVPPPTGGEHDGHGH